MISMITIFILILVTFILMHLLPGTPFSGNKILPEDILQAIHTKYGLDKSIFQQFIIYFENLLHGDLGISLSYNRPVIDIIWQAFPVSLELGIRALIFVFTFGIFFGSFSALKKGTKFDKFSNIFVLLGVSIPSFVVGALLQYVLGLKLYQLTGISFFSILGWNGENSKLLPAFTLAFGSIATIIRLMRTSMLEVLQTDYILTAKAKGLSEPRILFKHGFKNAFIPVLTYLGPLTAVVLTGTFVVENIFSIPGLGKYFVLSAQNYDYPLIIGTTLFFGIFLILCILIVDILYVLFDPRIILSNKKGGDNT